MTFSIPIFQSFSMCFIIPPYIVVNLIVHTQLLHVINITHINNVAIVQNIMYGMLNWAKAEMKLLSDAFLRYARLHFPIIFHNRKSELWIERVQISLRPIPLYQIHLHPVKIPTQHHPISQNNTDRWKTKRRKQSAFSYLLDRSIYISFHVATAI
jgi:hypothetical protein